MASPISSPAPPLHVQHLEKALRLEPFLGFVEGIFSDPFLGSLSDSDISGLSDLERDFTPKDKDGVVNGDGTKLSSNGFLQPEELKIDKTRLYNFTKVKKERRWLKDILLSDSSESSDEDEPLGEDDLHQMLWFHKQQKKAQQCYYQDGELSRYQHYSTGLLYSQDKYHDLQMSSSKKMKKKMKDGQVKFVKMKKEKVKIKNRKKSEDQSDDHKRLNLEERVLKKILIRRKEADAKRRKIWSILCRKEIPRAQRQKSSARNNVLSNAKKLAQLCQKERRREALRSQRISQQTAPRAKRLSREMLAYWKKYEKVEKEHRKRAEKEAMEQRKMDDELREARRQQRKLNFLITQTELYAHFMSKKLKNSKNANSDIVQNILKKLDEPSSSHMVKTVQGGVVYDMENMDNYDSKALKMEAFVNAQNAMKEQDARTQAFDSSLPPDHPSNKKVTLSQESFDENFSLANPNLTIDHPQPNLFQGLLKTYQLKGMNWLITLYEQGINGILADEMGLGKTVQSIAFLTYLAEVHHIWGPFLVVAPASTLHNWQQEAARFIPEFKVLPYWGNQGDRKSLRKFWSQKQGHISDKDEAPFHLLITSYQLVVQDVRYFQRIKWQYIILDEAQAIKSSSSVRWKILLGYQCRNRLLLTGTPIQNSMAELWALLHFIMPTLFDSHEEFNEWFSKDIESHAENKSIIDQNQLSRLHMILKPFMLRRIKRDVENELSDKIEIKLVCGLTTRQRWLYQAVRNKISIDDLVYTSASSSSAANATTSSLMNLVMQFRKVCNHPELFERRDVYSPISTGQLSSYFIPKLVYREGIVDRMFPGCTKILYNTINLWSPDHIAKSLHCHHQVPESSCFSFLRFINVSPEEAAVSMQRGLTYRILLLLMLLKEVRHLHHRRFWSREKPSKFLGRHSLLLWPSLNTSFPNIQTSSALSSLVFTGYTKPILAHLTHHIEPLLDEKDQSPRKAGPSRLYPISPLKHSATGPFSPPGHHSTGTTSSHHHHHHHRHHHHHHHHRHRRKSQSGLSPTEDHRGSVYIYPTVGHNPSNEDIPMKYSQLRELQPTAVPSLLMAYIPKLVAGNNLSYCSDRSAAYEIQDLVLGGSELKRNLLLYGDPDGCDLKKLKTQLFPVPLGGLEGSRPPMGWSFVQMPCRSALITDSGKLTVLDGLLTKLKLQGHRILIYSQMTRMIDILEEFMTYRKHKYMRLDGSSKISDRRDMVDDFQNKSDIFVFLLSTRAGGLGINLTAADTVIFYDSDWNPTVDQQAMDRAHRLGQTRQVTVYRLVTKNTIEERILQRANEKSEIQKMVISGGHFKPDALKPKEVVSLLLDDEELESKFLLRQAEKKADEQRKRRERKRKKGIPAEMDSPIVQDNQGTPPPKAKKGRKSKSSLFPPAPETGTALSEVSSANGLTATDMDDISVMSLDEVSLASGDGSLQSTEANQSNVATPSSIRPENDDSVTLDDPSSETASPTTEPTSKRGKARGRARGRTRGSSMRGRGTGPLRVGRGRGRGRGSSGALAASAAASAAAAAASAAAYAAYGFTFQGTPTINTPTPPPSRSSPVAFGGGSTLLPGGNAISQPIPRYDMETGNHSSNTSEPSSQS